MSVITYRMPFGVQGDISRAAMATVESQALNAAAPFTQYGIAGKVLTGKFVPVTANNDVVYGFLARPYPITGANASDALGTSVPPTTGIANILRRGYINVVAQLGGASAQLGVAVNIRYQNPSGSQIVGGVEGAATGNTYAISATTGGLCYFTGPVDANNICEIGFNI